MTSEHGATDLNALIVEIINEFPGELQAFQMRIITQHVHDLHLRGALRIHIGKYVWDPLDGWTDMSV